MSDIFSGYKTHAAAIIVIIAGVLYSFGWLDEKAVLAVGSIVGGAGLSFLRMGVKNDND